MRLTQQTRTLTNEKEEMAKSLALLKDLVQVRELQIVAVTSRLAQLNSGPNAVKTEIAGLDGNGSIDALLQQQPTVQALEAIQSARAEAQVSRHTHRRQNPTSSLHTCLLGYSIFFAMILIELCSFIQR